MPKTNEISKPAPAINNGVWGSKNKLSISTSSAWNHKNTNNIMMNYCNNTNNELVDIS
jgi:hypothetical protein